LEGVTKKSRRKEGKEKKGNNHISAHNNETTLCKITALLLVSFGSRTLRDFVHGFKRTL